MLISISVRRAVRVIDYVRHKYGERYVSHIILRDPRGEKCDPGCRAGDGTELREADMIAKMVEARPGAKLEV